VTFTGEHGELNHVYLHRWIAITRCYDGVCTLVDVRRADSTVVLLATRRLAIQTKKY
jgi:hypothetical protein